MRRVNTLTPFGRRVKRLMIDKEMTMRELAEQIGCRPNYLSMMLYGTKSLGRYEDRIRYTLDMDTNQNKGA